MKRALLIALFLPFVASAQWQMDFDEMAAVCSIAPVSSAWDTITNLTDHWLCNDNAANTTVANSIGGQSATGTVNTSAMAVSGKIGGGFQMDGTNRWIQATANQTITALYPITTMAWVRWDGNNGQAYSFVLDNALQTNGECSVFLAVKSDGKMYSGYGGRYGLHPTVNINGGGTALVSGNWSHIVSTFDGSTIKTYINATLNQNAAPGGDLSYFGARPWIIGAPNKIDRGEGSYLFHGLIDDVRVYNRVLSTNEIARIYNAGSGTENE